MTYRIAEHAGVEAGDAPAAPLSGISIRRVGFEGRTLALRSGDSAFTLDTGRLRAIHFERR